MVGLPVVRSAKDLKILTHSRRSTEAMLTLSFTGFLHQVRSKGLGISLLKDESTCYWSSDLTSSITHALPDDRRLKQSIDGFMKSLCVTEVRQGRSSKKLSNNETHQWFSARRFRLTSSVFGEIFHRRAETPPDALVVQLIEQRQITSPAIQWGVQQEMIALQLYVDY